MHASSYRLTAAHLFYALTLAAAATALFGWLGLPLTALISLVWWQLLCGAHRERRSAQDLVPGPQSCRGPPTRPGSPTRVTSREGVSKAETLVALLIVCLLVGLLAPAASDSDPMRHAEISMQMVAKAIQAYEAEHGQLPPVVAHDAHGQPMHSWRALILPYLGEEQLANSYRFDEPWDSPNNLRLSQYKPWHFRIYYPNHEQPSVTTSMNLLPLEDSFVLLEHEQIRQNWLEPQPHDEQGLRTFESPPTVREGFWKRGFFSSRYRGRLIVSPSQCFRVQPIAASELSHVLRHPPSKADSLAVGAPLVRLHGDNALRLAVFLMVALYPIRWLRQVRG